MRKTQTGLQNLPNSLVPKLPRYLGNFTIFFLQWSFSHLETFELIWTYINLSINTTEVRLVLGKHSLNIHNFGEKKYVKKVLSNKILKKLGIGSPWLKTFCWFIFKEKLLSTNIYKERPGIGSTWTRFFYIFHRFHSRSVFFLSFG